MLLPPSLALALGVLATAGCAHGPGSTASGLHVTLPDVDGELVTPTATTGEDICVALENG